MTETLVIRLRASEDAPASWLIVDANGARSGNVQSGPVADALALSQGRRPWWSCLPPMSRSPVRISRSAAARRIAQAVPFALEEHLASDLENLHFAIGQRDASSSATPVAIVAAQPLERWQAAWDAAGIRPDAAYAESSPDPSAPNALVMVLDEGTLHVQPGHDKAVYALDAEPLAMALDLALGEQTEAGETRHVLRVDCRLRGAEGHDRRAAGAHSDAAGQAVAGGHAVPAGLAGAGRQADQPAAGRVCGADVIRFAAAAMASARCACGGATLVAFLGAQGFNLWQLHQAEKQLDAQIAATFNQILPGQTDRRCAGAGPGRIGSRRRRQQCPAPGHLFIGASHCAGARHTRRSHQLPRRACSNCISSRQASKRSTVSSRP